MTRRLGRPGNALREASEDLASRYGDDPEAARRRMRWSRRMAAAAYLASTFDCA
ncbi:hypothetical protein [Sporichthya sp.]|uniref:hypothetical protein n=1 Tax=Sporichthya sp. TaxID=65475 RepID=UPI0017FD7E15|nr:hypothetical protein [Sporichthya sp.]MBA3745316.1 hypothetical protein [Sporichthya sp.]